MSEEFSDVSGLTKEIKRLESNDEVLRRMLGDTNEQLKVVFDENRAAASYIHQMEVANARLCRDITEQDELLMLADNALKQIATRTNYCGEIAVEALAAMAALRASDPS